VAIVLHLVPAQEDGTMIRAEDRTMKKLATLTGVMLLATAEALAAENQSRPARKVVVSLADRKLAVMEAGRVVKIFSTAVGAPSSPSPTGSYEIINRLAEPTWYGHGKVVPPGKSNPIGTRWMGLSAKGYGIHGTNAPASIGHNASHGCIRLRNGDVEELFEMVAVGDAVELYDGHTPELDRIFGAAVSRTPAIVAQVQTASAAVNR
jgi:lipoprotein-anchoring transpeptidase ErfK/SrfK